MTDNTPHNEEWLQEEQKIKDKAIEINNKVRLLMEDATFTLGEVSKIGPMLDDNSTPDEDRKTRKQIGIFLNRLRLNAIELNKVDKEHEALKHKVLKFYSLPPNTLPDDKLSDHVISMNDINSMLKSWTNMCKEIDAGEAWKDDPI